MSKSKIIALGIGVACLVGVVAYSAYGMDETRDVVTLAEGADIPARSPETVSPFGDPANVPATSPAEPERINGIIVPPMPDEAANNATLRGIDSDNDGVRDDINRFIAEEFGGDSGMYKLMLVTQRALEMVLTNPTEENKALYALRSGCLDYGPLESASAITMKYANTQQRVQAYRSVLAGLRVSIRNPQDQECLLGK